MRVFKIGALLLLGLTTTAGAGADVDAALDTHVLPGWERFAAATETLAGAECSPDALRPAFADATRAWAAVSHLNIGPAAVEGRARIILFWPEERNATARGLRLLIQQGPDAWTPDLISRASAAARGLAGLERLIWEEDGAPCDLTRALADDLSGMAADIRDGWTEEFADLMRTAGEAGNTRFLAEDEAMATFYTALLTGLEFTAEYRLARPMGTFDAPQPMRAQLYRSELSQEIIVASLRSLRELARVLVEAPRTMASLDRAVALAEALDDAGLQGVADPMGRFRVEALQSAVRDAHMIAAVEIGSLLNVTVGFNSGDGD
ncbi:imelysin family protein [Jannaschia sp. 2305UL9-9]|uniref:imelysin family protein n=1 Tax=Jannaschia sp. 2305UL9-9 TaxID=3121638 RepID=UPI0035290C8D